MTKEEIIHLSNNLYEEALKAKSYFEIIKQYQTNQTSYNEQMNFSPAFYRLTYSALNDALIMSLAKVYDSDDESLSFDTLKDECIEGNTFKEFFYSSKIQNGENRLVKHTIKEGEKCFLKKEIEESKIKCKELGIPYNQPPIELSLEEYLNLISKKKQSLSRGIRSVRTLRNKIYAHNDKNINFNFDMVLDKHGLSRKMVEALIDLALEFFGFCYTSLTEIVKADDYLNISDWNQTLYYAKLGSAYREMKIKEWEKNPSLNIHDVLNIL